MYQKVRPILFRMDPERAHDLTLSLLRTAGSLPPVVALLRLIYQPKQATSVNLLGLDFPNPIGLAAGYDKDGTSWRGLSALGFGHIELGTVTPEPQFGNPKPRIYRLPDQQAVINRMGFPGSGADFLLGQFKKHQPAWAKRNFVLGINLGKNKDTPNASAVEDYRMLLRTFYEWADYFAVNVSSPNTIGLRRLQARDYLEQLVQTLNKERNLLHRNSGCGRPLLIKLSPDLTDQALDDALDAILSGGADGVIATNTTLSRDGVVGDKALQKGGLSGMPLRERSTHMIRKISDRTQGSLPIIGVGGIHSVADAAEKMSAGADLIQVYTGLIYQGPGLVKTLVEGI